MSDSGLTHRVKSMPTSELTNTSTSNDVWFVNFGTSNHMTSHGEWFRDLRMSDQLGYVETEDNPTHPIRHVGNFSLEKEGNKTCIKNVLHVPTIMKNLVSVGQIMEKGMQVRFNNGGCFIEKKGRLITKGCGEGQRFILDLDEVYWPCMPKVSRLRWISSCGKRESTISTSNGFERCNRREPSSDFRRLRQNKLPKCVKHVNSKNNIDTQSQRINM